VEIFNSPHGGELINRILTGKERAESLKKAQAYPRIMLDDVETNDLELIATGAYSPLTGFMNQQDYLSVLKRNCLENGFIWTVPITLNVPKKIADKIKNNNWVALIDKDGKVLATMHVTDKYKLDRALEVQLLYQSMRAKQIELEQLYQNREIALGGEIFLLNRPSHAVHSKYRQDPVAMRDQLRKLGWCRIIAFQAPNPISHSTDSIEKCALEIVDGLLWQPQIAEVKMGENLLHQKMENHYEMIEQYYPAEKVYLSYLPWVSRQAGPREVVLEAIVRKNYGCTHYIVAEKQYRMYNFYTQKVIFRLWNLAGKIFSLFWQTNCGMKMFPERHCKQTVFQN
jgi:sulfate adenylyltransferase